VFANLVGWVETVTQKLIFAKVSLVKTVEYVLTTKMLTSANALKDTVETTVNILDRYAIGDHVNMVVPASATQMDLMVILVSVLQEQLEPIVKKILETSVPTTLAKIGPNALTELEILIVIVRQPLEAKTVKSRISHPLVE